MAIRYDSAHRGLIYLLISFLFFFFNITTPTTRVCAIYRTPLGCYESLIRSDLFIYSSCRSVTIAISFVERGGNIAAATVLPVVVVVKY